MYLGIMREIYCSLNLDNSNIIINIIKNKEQNIMFTILW